MCLPIEQCKINKNETINGICSPENCILPYTVELSGSNIFGTMKISSRQRKFEPLRVDYSARSEGFMGTSFRLSLI